MALRGLPYLRTCYCSMFVYMVLCVCTLLATAAEFEGQHGVLRQGDRCVYTLLIPHVRGEDCRELCETYEQLCWDDSAVNDLILQLQTKISHCGSRKDQASVFKHGDSCTYVFSQPVGPNESRGDDCPEICTAVSDICVADDTVSELRQWILGLGGENERLKSMILQLLARADELELQKHALETEKYDFMEQMSKVQNRNQVEEGERGRRREEARLHTNINHRHQSEIDRLRNTLHILTNQATEFQNDVNGCLNELNDTKEALRKETDSSEELRTRVRHLQGRMSQRESQIVELQKDNDRYATQVEELNSAMEELRRENCQSATKGVQRVIPTAAAVLPVTTIVEEKVYESVEDCRDVQRSGVYMIQSHNDTKPFQVYCDMQTDSGGWTIVQRRQDGSEDFYRSWDDYKNGFGDLNGEFWLGNDKIHRLTTQGRQYELRVDLENFENETRYAKYDDFAISDEGDKYRLALGSYRGNAGDAMKFDKGRQFTTRDNDNDRSGNHNCAQRFTGAWWFSSCSMSNLNGQYLRGPNNAWGRGIVWYDWLDMKYSLKRTEIKMRPVIKEGSD